MARARRRPRRRNRRKLPALIGVRSAVTGEPTKPTRGVRLSTVSILTVLFALACLAAFAAGRPPLSAAGPERGQEHAPRVRRGQILGHDNAGRFLGHRLRERKTGAQEIKKSAGARTSVGVLLADPQEKNEQPEHV